MAGSSPFYQCNSRRIVLHPGRGRTGRAPKSRSSFVLNLNLNPILFSSLDRPLSLTLVGQSQPQIRFENNATRERTISVIYHTDQNKSQTRPTDSDPCKLYAFNSTLVPHWQAAASSFIRQFVFGRNTKEKTPTDWAPVARTNQ